MPHNLNPNIPPVAFSRRLKSACLLLIEKLATIYCFVRYWLIGRSYTAFYARMMDLRVRRYRQWGLHTDKQFQLEYLKAHGLEPSMSLLDYGCGAAAAGRYFIDYLEEGHYVGVDISTGVIQEGRRRISKWGIEAKKPILLLDDGSLDSLLGLGRRFDVVWAQSVLTHMPPQDIEQLLCRIQGVMNEHSTFYANFARTDHQIRSSRMKDWYYPVEFMERAAAAAGMNVTVMSDWQHPNDAKGIDTLVRFTLNRA